VHYLDVGQGDATLLQHADATVLIDTGRHQGSEVVPALRAAGVETIDLVVVTHPHADHIGQFDQVLDSFTVTEVWWSGSTTTTQTFDRALAALERSDAAYEEPRTGDTALIGPLELEVINPPAGTALDDLHDANLALRVTYGEVRFLFTGDAEAATEARMTARSAATLDADILQLGHHGSRTSTTPAFLAAVDPAVAIYSASTGNQYGHPHGEVLDRVLAAGVEVFGTAVHGTVTVTTDGDDWTIATQRAGTPVAGDATSAPAPAARRPAATRTRRLQHRRLLPQVAASRGRWTSTAPGSMICSGSSRSVRTGRSRSCSCARSRACPPWTASPASDQPASRGSSRKGSPVSADSQPDIPPDRAVVDRIVDGTTAVLLVGPTEDELLVPADSLPEEAAEGSWVVVDLDADPPTVSGIDHELTEARSRDLEARMERAPRAPVRRPLQPLTDQSVGWSSASSSSITCRCSIMSGVRGPSASS
jgi:beta-lactamase superfamily II metal-dependent hydrolase